MTGGPAPGRSGTRSARRRRVADVARSLSAPLLLDLRRLAHAIAEVIELGPADVASGHHFDLGDGRRVEREGPLDTDAVAHLAHGEGLTDAGALAADDRALEHLHALLGALDDAHVHLEGVTRPEVRDVVPETAIVEKVGGVHGSCSGTGWREAEG